MDHVGKEGAVVTLGYSLLVDADTEGSQVLVEAVRSLGHRVTAFPSLRDALDCVREPPDAVLLDYGGLRGRGPSAVGILRAVFPDVCIIFLSHIASVAGAVACMKAGADEFLTKPVSADEIDAMLRRSVDAPARKAVSSLGDQTRSHALATLRGVGDDLPSAARLLLIKVLPRRRILDGPVSTARSRSPAEVPDGEAQARSALGTHRRNRMSGGIIRMAMPGVARRSSARSPSRASWRRANGLGHRFLSRHYQAATG